MHHVISYFLLIVIFLILKFFLKNFKTKFHLKHQKFAGKESIPLIGGLVMFCFYSYSLFFDDKIILAFSFLILLIGIFSDNNFLESPKLRLIIQAIILLNFTYFSNITIQDLRNEYLNTLVSNYYFGIIFTSFCFLVLINGSNFIDGLDGLNLGYFFLVILFIYQLNSQENININNKTLMTIFYIVSFLLILNIFNLLYLGDSGSYLIGFIFGIFLIKIDNSNQLISPYFIALLLWYPAFENLFSIIRKKVIKKDPLRPDNSHLHQMLYNLIKKNKNNFVKKFSNFISSTIIIFYNLLIFTVSISYSGNTKILLMLLALNVTVYIFVYSFLKRFN